MQSGCPGSVLGGHVHLSSARARSQQGSHVSTRDGDVCVYLWLIHDSTWQKTTKFCKAIIPQKKKKTQKSEVALGIRRYSKYKQLRKRRKK